MPKASADLVKLVESQSQATVAYYKAKLSLVEAHSKFVSQALREGVLDLGSVPSYR